MPTTTLPYKDLATEANQFMTGQAMAPYLANLPNYANMVGQRTGNITQQLKGQLPQDVINQIGQQAAERGVATGSPGSPNANAAYLRALGLNSLQMQQQGSQNLSTAIADTPVPQLFNPMSLVVPEMLAKHELSAARSGMGTGGTSIGMPNLSAPRGTTGGSFSSIVNPPALSGPSWGNPSGMFSGGNFSGGMWAGNPAPTGGGAGGGYGGVGFSTPDFDPTAYTFASGGQYGGSVDWGSLYQDPNMPAGWAEQDWGGPFNQIDASNPDNAFMFE